jgi:hypothetical protein
MVRLQERAVVQTDAPEGYTAQKGDAVIVDMTPYEVLEDDSKGPELPKFAGKTPVLVHMIDTYIMLN